MLTSAQLSEWEVFDVMDPIGDFRGDFHMAFLSALLMNIVSKLYTKKGHQPKYFSYMDFMPEWDPVKKEVEVKKQTVEEMKQVFNSIARYQNSPKTRRRLLKKKK